jgi:hypothetical protein
MEMNRVRRFWKTIVVAIGFFWLFPSIVFSATVTSVYDQPSTLLTSAPSNHRILFVTASDIDEGREILVTFPSSFTTTSITEDDVDISDDSVDLTTAADCTGTEQASVTMVTDVLTISICAGDGGAITAASTVIIEIGTNASASGIGANQVTNPGSVATYFLALGGNFGPSFDDRGSIPVPIVSREGGNVAASVPTLVPGGSGGGPEGDPSPEYSIVLDAPNGGEVLDGSDFASILWSHGEAAGLVDLYYSIDGGASYAGIVASESNDGTYTWLVPDVTTTRARVKINGMDASTILTTDSSDANFTIIGSSIGADYLVTVTGPNGGEVYEPSSSHVITWTSGSMITAINLFYSLNGGGSYTSIASSETNDGAYQWTLPSLESTNVLIKIEGLSADTAISSDVSNAPFTIETTEIIEEEELEEELPPEEPPVEPPTEPPIIPPVEEPGEETGEEPGEEPGATEETPSTPGAAPETTTETTGVAYEVDVTVTSSDGSVEIGGEDGVSVLPGIPVLIRTEVPDNDEVTDVTVIIGNQDYFPSEVTDGVYFVSAPIPGGVNTIIVEVRFRDGSTRTSVGLAPQSYGLIYEVIDGQNIPVSGVVVTVLQSGSLWNGQNNPMTTGNDGAVGWYAPNGIYLVRIEKNGHETEELAFVVSNQILAPVIEMRRNEEPIIVEEPTDIISEVAGNTYVAISAVISDVRGIAEVQTVADIAAPIVIATAVSSAAVLATSFNIFAILQYLFTAPILFFARRRRQNFGIIYNAVTKVPIDLAVVRLYGENGKLVRTMVTDSLGRYFFKVDEGKYFIRVTKQGFTFPSGYLSGQKADGKYLDLYTEGYLQVTDRQAVIAANIPVDPVSEEGAKVVKRIRYEKMIRVFQNILALTGIILAFYVVIIQPSTFSYCMLGVQAIIYLMTRLLIRPKKKKGWGIVYEAKTRSPLANTIVRLFEPKYHKLLETAITDREGRYTFLVGPNEYYATFEKTGYEPREVRPIDYRNKKELTPISVDVPLARQV